MGLQFVGYSLQIYVLFMADSGMLPLVGLMDWALTGMRLESGTAFRFELAWQWLFWLYITIQWCNLGA